MIRRIGILLAALAAVAVLGMPWAVIGCGKVTVGPFYPNDPKPCDSDAKCPDGMHCWVVAVDTRPICLDGESDIDAPPPDVFGAARDGGATFRPHRVNCVTRNDAGELTYGWCPDTGR